MPPIVTPLLRALLLALLFLPPTAALTAASRYADPYPTARSRKGLQVQMVDDALALGIGHAALNLNLAGLIDPAANPAHPRWESDGRTFHFQPGYLDALDRQVKPLSDAGVLVHLIILTYASGNTNIDRLLLHPRYDPAAPNHLGAFNTVTDDGRRWFTACLEFLAERWSRPASPHGRVAGYIIGNEVNSHWFWSNQGRVPMQTFADDYLQAVRLAHHAIRRQSASARVYLSLEHHWNIRYPGGDELQAFPGRPFLDYFARRAREGGDFDWHVAFHPYPENLFEPRTWNDRSATPDFDTPRITFKNLPVLTDYLRRPDMLFEGKPRRVLLSEQGFHTPDGPDGETAQAAAYCYAWMKMQPLEGIDAFILHRHVDHAHEGGLRLGLWTHQPGSVATPDRKKRIYDVFRAADTPRWREASDFALPVIGIKSWSDLR